MSFVVIVNASLSTVEIWLTLAPVCTLIIYTICASAVTRIQKYISCRIKSQQQSWSFTDFKWNAQKPIEIANSDFFSLSAQGNDCFDNKSTKKTLTHWRMIDKSTKIKVSKSYKTHQNTHTHTKPYNVLQLIVLITYMWYFRSCDMWHLLILFSRFNTFHLVEHVE